MAAKSDRPKGAAKSGPQKWRSKKDPKSGGQKWTPKVVVSVLLSASVERFDVSRMRDFSTYYSETIEKYMAWERFPISPMTHKGL